MTRTPKKNPVQLVRGEAWEQVEKLAGPVHTEGSTTNPLIGYLPMDTLNYCDQVLSVLQDASEVQDSSDETGMGKFLILLSVRRALQWESENYHARAGLRRKEDQA